MHKHNRYSTLCCGWFKRKLLTMFLSLCIPQLNNSSVIWPPPNLTIRDTTHLVQRCLLISINRQHSLYFMSTWPHFLYYHIGSPGKAKWYFSTPKVSATNYCNIIIFASTPWKLYGKKMLSSQIPDHNNCEVPQIQINVSLRNYRCKWNNSHRCRSTLWKVLANFVWYATEA